MVEDTFSKIDDELKFDTSRFKELAIKFEKWLFASDEEEYERVTISVRKRHLDFFKNYCELRNVSYSRLGGKLIEEFAEKILQNKDIIIKAGE